MLHPSKLTCVVIAGLFLTMALNAEADSLVVHTETGDVRGKSMNDGKVRAWLGIPYAAPPVGDRRWKAAQPAASWPGERDATKFGAHSLSLRSSGRILKPGLVSRVPKTYSISSE